VATWRARKFGQFKGIPRQINMCSSGTVKNVLDENRQESHA